VTTASLLSVIRRRWNVVIIGLFVTIVGFALLSHPGGAYSTQMTIVFLSPGDKVVGAVNDGNTVSLVDFAAVVERKIHHGKPSDRMAENAPLYGTGVDKGYQVLLLNSGTQWQNSFASPALTVKVVGPTPVWVEHTLETVINRIRAIARDTQLAAGTAEKNMISSEQVPSVPSVSYIGSTHATQARAFVALMSVGLALSAVAAVAVDRLVNRRHRAARNVGGGALMRWPDGGTAQ
jgi:hypothetical protein